MLRKRTIAWVFVLGSWTYLGYAAITSPSFRAWLQNCSGCWSAGSRWNSAEDPSIGVSVDLPRADVFGRKLTTTSADSHLLLALAGQCTECVLSTLTPDRLRSSSYELIVLVFTSPVPSWPKACRELPDDFRLVFDPDNRLGAALNAAWLPRFYVLDSQFRLSALQLPIQDPRGLVPRVAGFGQQVATK